MTWSAVVVSLAAAVAFGWSTALMHHGASGADEDVAGLALLRHVVVQWRWLLGVVASLIGLGLHALALHLGSLTLVQPLVVTGLFFSLVFRDALDRRAPSRRTMTWGAITAAGLGLFLVAAGSAGGSDVPNGRHAAAMIGVGLLCALLVFWTSSRSPLRAGLLLGTSAGLVFGLVAGALKATTNALGHHELFVSWPLYTMVCLGLTGFLLNQHVYHQARLSDSLPMLNMVNPLVSLVFGVVVFDERPRGNALAILVEAVGLAAVLSGIFFLGRSDEAVAAPSSEQAPSTAADPASEVAPSADERVAGS